MLLSGGKSGMYENIIGVSSAINIFFHVKVGGRNKIHDFHFQTKHVIKFIISNLKIAKENMKTCYVTHTFPVFLRSYC